MCSRDHMLAEAPPHLTAVLDSFPPVQHAFAYGSGVFSQPGLYGEHEGTDCVAGGAAGASLEGSDSSRAAAAAAAAAVAGDRPMLDFIFAVDDPVAWHTEVMGVPITASMLWSRSSRIQPLPCVIRRPSHPHPHPPFPRLYHRQNLRRNRHHYSLLGRLGPDTLVAAADRIGAGVYFNTLVPWREHQARVEISRSTAFQLFRFPCNMQCIPSCCCQC